MSYDGGNSPHGLIVGHRPVDSEVVRSKTASVFFHELKLGEDVLDSTSRPARIPTIQSVPGLGKKHGNIRDTTLRTCMVS